MSLAPWIAAVAITGTAVALAVVNISNIVRGAKKRQGMERRAEVSPPMTKSPGAISVGVATFGLGVFCGLYVLLAFLGLEGAYPLDLLQIPQPEGVRAAGVLLFVAGAALFAWSVISRGRYSVSWAMPVDQELVTWGPYKYIRHPSYTGYFLMFTGLFFVWFNLLTVILFPGIPGYYQISKREEKMLVLRFGDAYIEYQKKTGKFIPRLWI